MRDVERFGILRFINYKETSIEGLDKVIRYIRNPLASPPELQYHSFLSRSCPVEDFKAIEARYKRHGGRLYKQCVLSFGCPVNDENIHAALKLVKDLMGKYRGQYPFIAALHTNVIGRLHAHIVMGMANIQDGHKFDQSAAELQDFKERYNKAAIAVGLHPLKQWVAKYVAVPEMINGTTDADMASIPVPALPIAEPIPSPWNGKGNALSLAEIGLTQGGYTREDGIRLLMEQFSEDSIYFYNMGKGIKGGKIHE